MDNVITLNVACKTFLDAVNIGFLTIPRDNAAGTQCAPEMAMAMGAVAALQRALSDWELSKMVENVPVQ